jgi:RNA polymerase sigma-70 factor (ECF subfamily)
LRYFNSAVDYQDIAAVGDLLVLSCPTEVSCQSTFSTFGEVQEILKMAKPYRFRNWKWAVGVSAAWLGVAFADLPPAQAAETALAEKNDTKQAAQKKKQLLLKYGDNKPDGKRSIAGAGEMIRFEVDSEAESVRAIRVHGSRYGYPQAPKEDFEVSLLSADMKEVLHTELVPYSLFKRAKKGRWTHVPFKDAVEVPPEFWVVLDFNAEKTKGVYVSYDTSTKGKHSRIGSTDEDARETDFGGDWMVQVLLAK